MSVKDFVVNNSKVKLRYREPYVTSGINEKFLSLPRGCYRGFLPRCTTVPDMKIWLAVDPLVIGLDTDSFAIFSKKNEGAPNSDGWSLSIRETEDVALDLSGSAFDPIPAGVSYLYVYIDADYQVGSSTTCTYNVSDEDPYNVASSNYDTDVILIGRVPVVPAATTINFDITNSSVYSTVVSVRKLPSPTTAQDETTLGAGDDRWGFFDSVSKWRTPSEDEKEAMINATNPPTASNPFVTQDDSFGAVNYIGESTIKTVGPSSGGKVQIPGLVYVGNGTNNTARKFFYLTDSSADFNKPYTTANGNLVLIDEIYRSNGTTVLNPSTDANSMGFYDSPYIYLETDGFPGVPHNITSLGVLCFEQSLLNDLNQSPASLIPFVGAVFDSHAYNITAKEKTGTPDNLATQTVQDQLIELLTLLNARGRLGASETVLSTWTFNGGLNTGDAIVLSADDAFLRGDSIDTDWHLIFRTNSSDGAKIYYGSNGDGIIITRNARWDSSAWKANTDSEDSFGLKLSDNGITIHRMDKNDSNHNNTTGWTDSQWTSSLVFGGSDLTSGVGDPAPMNAFGSFDSNSVCYDRVRFCLSVDNIGASSIAIDNDNSVTWHSKLNGALSGDVTISADFSTNWTDTPSIRYLDQYGCMVKGKSDVLNPGINAHWYGTIEIDTTT